MDICVGTGLEPFVVVFPFNADVCLVRKSLKYCLLSSTRYGFGAGFGAGRPRAKAREDDEELIPGGGGVGYAVDGAAVCWKTLCANGVVWYDEFPN